ncbi:ABC transporter permease [bacterium]|nr:ABC transporter permease [bacterium]
MKLSRNLMLSLDILAAHRLRTFLSVTGIVAGVAAVVVMVSVGRGAEKKILSMIESMGTNLLIVNAGQTKIVAGRQRQVDMVTSLTPADAEAIPAECPSVVRASAVISRRLATRWQTGIVNTTVIGMSADGFAIRKITLAAGRFFDDGEGRARRRVAVLGPTAARNLFGSQDPLGQSFRIGRVPFEVIGLAVPRGMDINGTDLDDAVIVPLETAMLRLYYVPYLESVYVQARDGGPALAAAEREIADLLRARHRLRARPDDFTIQNQATLLTTQRDTTRSLTLLTGSVAAISLLVGGVGILAVMLISVRERRREIGLRRAVGALRTDIRNQFLLESALVACGGGSIGIVLGMIIALIVSLAGLRAVSLSWGAAALGFVFSASVGLIFGIYPAVRAAALEPITALRAE